jgi:hypothetical protein
MASLPKKYVMRNNGLKKRNQRHRTEAEWKRLGWKSGEDRALVSSGTCIRGACLEVGSHMAGLIARVRSATCAVHNVVETRALIGFTQ